MFEICSKGGTNNKGLEATWREKCLQNGWSLANVSKETTELPKKIMVLANFVWMSFKV